jgi:hypothetical protein
MDVDFTKFGGVPVDAPTGAVDFAKLGGVPVETAPAKTDPTAGMSTTDKILAGAGQAFVSGGRAVKQATIDAQQAAGRIPGVGKYLNAQTPEQLAQLSQQTGVDIEEAKRLDAPLLATGAGTAGNIVGNAIMLAPTALIPGAATVPGAALIGALGSGLTTPGDLTERGIAAGIGAVGGAGGTYLGGKIAQQFANRPAQLAAQEAQAATKNATLAASREAGYKVPPTAANPTIINKVLESFAGKQSVQQAASVENQAITNNLARKALNLPEDAPLTRDTLQAVRQQAGQAYEAVKGAGTITTDAQYTSDLLAISKKYTGAAKDFPELAKNDVAAIVSGANKPQFGADSAIDMISILRDRTNAAYASGDKALAKAYKETAAALEDVIDRNLTAKGQGELLGNYRDARQMIAKSYSVENALNESTGNVQAKKLAGQLWKGKPLTGELETAGRFGQSFDKAAQEMTTSVPGSSPLDYAVAGTTAMMTGNPHYLGMVAGRPIARNIILSGPYQRMMTTPNYEPGRITNALAALANNPASSNALRLLRDSAARSSGTVNAAQQ